MAKREPEKMIKKASDLFDIPGEAAAGVPRVTVTGRESVHVENHRGLLEYGRERISVNTGRYIIRVTGAGLELAAMSDMELLIDGDIRGIEYVV